MHTPSKNTNINKNIQKKIVSEMSNQIPKHSTPFHWMRRNGCAANLASHSPREVQGVTVAGSDASRTETVS